MLTTPLRLLTTVAAAFSFLFLLPAHAAAQFNPDPAVVSISATPQRKAVHPGDQFAIAVVLEFAEGWHAWPNKPVIPAELGEDFDAIPTTISLPEKATTGPFTLHLSHIQWPEPKPIVSAAFSGEDVEILSYAGTAVAYIPVTVDSQASPGRTTIPLVVSYQACDDLTCLMPADVPVEVPVEIVPLGAPTEDTNPALFTSFNPTVFADIAAAPPTPTSASAGDAPSTAASPSIFGIQLPDPTTPLGFIVVFLAAIAGGAILNLTPCVLPVIPIKILTLVQHAGGDRRRTLALGLWMALGVVCFWVAAGLPMAIFSAALDPSRIIFGTWWITLGLGLLIAAMGLGIMGLFMINLPQSVYMVNTKADSPSGSFMFGVMTAVLGLPCFGFVAGALLATASALPAVVIMAIFLGLGVGMALPYLVLAAFPKLVNKIPRTGPASELVKQVMGLLLLAAAAFFVAAGIKGLLTEKPWLKESMAWWAVAFFVILAGLWLTLRTLQIAKKTWPKVIMPLLSLAGIALSVLFAAGLAATAKEDHERLLAAQSAAGGADDGIVTGAWLPYTPARMEKALDSGHVVLVDFTADWCINCKALKRTVLDRDPVRSRVQQGDVVLIEVDLTTKTAPGWKFLAQLGRSNVPTLAIFGPGAKDPIIYNAYTPETVLAAIDQASSPAPSSPSSTPPTLGALDPAVPTPSTR